MGYLRSFVPWLVYAAVSAADWRWGAAAALASALAVIVRGHRVGEPADLITLGTAAFFAVLAGIAFTAPDSPVHPWTAAASLAWLAALAWASLAVRNPFTLAVARRSVPAEIQALPVFRRVNVVITAVWAAAFTATAVALAALHAAGAPGGAAALVQAAGFVVPAVFTARYPAHVQARAAARA